MRRQGEREGSCSTNPRIFSGHSGHSHYHTVFLGKYHQGQLSPGNALCCFWSTLPSYTCPATRMWQPASQHRPCLLRKCLWPPRCLTQLSPKDGDRRPSCCARCHTQLPSSPSAAGRAVLQSLDSSVYDNAPAKSVQPEITWVKNFHLCPYCRWSPLSCDLYPLLPQLHPLPKTRASRHPLSR